MGSARGALREQRRLDTLRGTHCEKMSPLKIRQSLRGSLAISVNLSGSPTASITPRRSGKSQKTRDQKLPSLKIEGRQQGPNRCLLRIGAHTCLTMQKEHH